ncbi:hypothetical protein P0D88_36160 [Paraburkholderia sp. RL18-103-BIB-C]|jgi:hypothetical protein|uniref:hypothetical protein n=1 Tax=unclassified Paraburkholderia TaxID=2615204 RepID=UPI0038B81779
MNKTLRHFGVCGLCALFTLVTSHPALAQDKLVEEANVIWNKYFSNGDAQRLAALDGRKGG